MIKADFVESSDIEDVVSEWVKTIFGFDDVTINIQIFPIIHLFLPNITYFIEYPYIDRYYRDSYYHFYSKKHSQYKRNSIRISLFSSNLIKEQFHTPEYFQTVQSSFLGYFTIRPTSHRVIGFSFISPKALKQNNFVACLTKKISLVNGYKFSLTGFPFLSQDNETITCSETALLNITDYFASRYADYSLLLPSQINKILNRHSYQRQLPSQGLPTENMSFVLKKIGFGTRVYAIDNENKNIYSKLDFKELIYAYIESGIPVIATLSSSEDSHHAIIIIGRDAINGDGARTIKNKQLSLWRNRVVEFNTFFSEILVMNDNHPPYEIVNFEKPQSNGKYQIKAFIVPLYSKVHVEAYQFKQLFFKLIEEFKKNDKTQNIDILPTKGPYILRYFLASSRTYKNYIASSKGLSLDLKSIITLKSMPKFIWVMEIIEGNALHNEQIVKSICTIDATESGLHNHLIFATDSTHLIFYKTDFQKDVNDDFTEKRNFQILKFENEIFYTFADNLTGAHKKWQI